MHAAVDAAACIQSMPIDWTRGIISKAPSQTFATQLAVYVCLCTLEMRLLIPH